MSDGSNLLDQIERGLDGVTGGKWCQFHPDYCEEANHAPFVSWDTSHEVSAVIGSERVKLATFKHADDAAHMDRCSPDAIREIAAYVRDLESRATAAEAIVAALREALEPFAKSDMAPDIYDDDSCVAGCCDFTCADLRRARETLLRTRK